MSQPTFGNKQIFETGRFNVPFVVLSVTTLISPSFPACMSLITAFIHTSGGRFSSFKSTKSPTATFG